MFNFINNCTKNALDFWTFFSYIENDLLNDVPRKWQLNFQKSASPVMDSIIDLHHDIMFVMIFIVISISYLLSRSLYLFEYNPHNFVNNVKHCTIVEVIWTIIPALILSWIALPSFALLYSLDGVVQPRVTVKAVGHQWYWSYESIDPIYSEHLQNHSALYKNFVNIYKRYYTLADTGLTENVSYDDFLFDDFLEDALQNCVEKGYSVDKLNTINDCLTDDYSGLVEDDFYGNEESSYFFLPIGLAHKDNPTLDNLFDQVYIMSGYDDRKVFETVLNVDLVFSGSLKDWKLQQSYNFYVDAELKRLLKTYTADYKTHISDSNLYFLNKKPIKNYDFIVAKYSSHLYPNNLHPYIKWTTDGSKFPTFYIPVNPEFTIGWYDPMLFYNKNVSTYHITSNFDKNYYSSFGFDYDSCLLSDDFLYKKRQRVRGDVIGALSKKSIIAMKKSGFIKKSGWFRLLDVDNRLLLPKGVNIRFLITSADVIHSWAIPSLGLKLDACPGRLNELGVFIKREGVFYGQCSEICGIHHGFMPISLQSTTSPNFKSWFLAKSVMHFNKID